MKAQQSLVSEFEAQAQSAGRERRSRNCAAYHCREFESPVSQNGLSASSQRMSES